MVFLITCVVFLSNVCHLWFSKYSGVVLGLKFESLPSDIFMREVVGSNPGLSNIQSLKIAE